MFNCDEGIDVKSMGRIFIGLVKCGAWGCFDEFNRLEEAVLSAVSMQIQTIQAALRVRAAQCELLDRQVTIIHSLAQDSPWFRSCTHNSCVQVWPKALFRISNRISRNQ